MNANDINEFIALDAAVAKQVANEVDQFLALDAAVAKQVADAEWARVMDEIADMQLAATIEHMDAAESGEGVDEIREQGAALLAEAAELDALGTEPVRMPRYRNGRQSGWTTRPVTDPRHPAHRAGSVRAAGERLARWTQADESGYRQYVNDGLADTDGWFAPEDRAAWAALAA